MARYDSFYIGGEWVAPTSGQTIDVVDPATGLPNGTIGAGNAVDVDKAVAAARSAFPVFSSSSVEYRLDLLENILDAYKARRADVAEAIRLEMGAPVWLADGFQSLLGEVQFERAIAALKAFGFERRAGTSLVSYEPIGVCGLITPWNWPINQVAAKVAPALAAGCTVVLKPSEIAPYSSYVLAEVIHRAGVPAGVFNLVNGTGPDAGAAIASHPDIDLVSFTGSTRAGIDITRNAAPTVKRVLQELGGKSPNVILDDADLEVAIPNGVNGVMLNSGQTCNAPTRMLVPRSVLARVEQLAAKAAETWTVGVPDSNAQMGPVASEAQWNKIQALIKAGIDEGASLITGGLGRPEGLDGGYYVRPTVFSNVSPSMRIAKEEIFGPVLSIIPYDDDASAIQIANDTEYGLAGYVSGRDELRTRKIARQIRAGQIFVNGANNDFDMPFGGYKKSGNGREWGVWGFAEFLEVKAIIGYESSAAQAS
jgi:aldehyde dehydrogenase (NAD+)